MGESEWKWSGVRIEFVGRHEWISPFSRDFLARYGLIDWLIGLASPPHVTMLPCPATPSPVYMVWLLFTNISVSRSNLLVSFHRQAHWQPLLVSMYFQSSHPPQSNPSGSSWSPGPSAFVLSSHVAMCCVWRVLSQYKGFFEGRERNVVTEGWSILGVGSPPGWWHYMKAKNSHYEGD